MTEYRVGDKIRVTDVTETIVIEITEGPRIRAENGALWLINPEWNGENGWTRTIEVIERAPVPWQAGDIAVTVSNVRLIRQASGTWFNHLGADVHFTDDDIDDRYKPVVRGGKRVTS